MKISIHPVTTHRDSRYINGAMRAGQLRWWVFSVGDTNVTTIKPHIHLLEKFCVDARDVLYGKEPGLYVLGVGTFELGYRIAVKLKRNGKCEFVDYATCGIQAHTINNLLALIASDGDTDDGE